MRKPVNPEDFNGNFVREAASIRVPCKNRENGMPLRMVTLRCKNCNVLFDVALNNAKRTKQQCCCGDCSHRLKETFVGGNERHPLYIRWLSMKQRCNNPNNENYKYYGAQGIYIESYLSEFIPYAKYIMSLSGYVEKDLHKLTIDRIDNEGSYTRGNLRWTNYSIQGVNQRARKNRSGYKGISRNTANTSWTARVDFKGKVYINKAYTKLQDAVEARNTCIINNDLPHRIQEFKQI